MPMPFALSRSVAAAALVAVIALATLTACGQKPAAAYAFAPLRDEVMMGNDALIDVRLTKEGSNDPVADAVIFDMRFDMEPDGMSAMAAPVKADGSPMPGTYRFIVKPTMAGRWALKLSAKVQGESDTVRGQVVVTAH